ncbi:hypothetical protein I862_03185 [endosymbiont of Acanthamoeba sp. UWC8]|uniref:hypothetical protein n=1 Tax=endosymbiont of Acanthamoeba sp. UWC8 TaxID=86106 RepID=UPI0004D0D9F6|nr:hypothetical protein [endosymbiont of Acanthamoeba sp. UWC8]AIF81198.1 hypothetical protein I862_03185 [endosymbiont of Acanthamoeba sp. UWC8]
MPKLKQVLKNLVSDKDERAEKCFDVVVKENGIELCDANTGVEVNSPTVITGIEMYDGGSLLEYCLNAFKEKGLIECNNPVKVHEVYNSGEIQCINGIIDKVQVRPSILDSGKETSIGKSINQYGKEIPGCKIIIRDFNPKEGDQIDLFKLYGKAFNNVNIFDITMNEQPSKAFHIAGDSAECTVALYGYSGDLTQDMFVLPQHIEGHTEL